MSGTRFDWRTHDWAACVGDGWRPLVQPLVDYCLAHDLPIHQVKEKFGGLRFYSACDDTLDALIDVAEEASYRTCEVCGQPGRIISPRGWLLCRCGICESADAKETT